jgi:aldehyde:ferredoxin oxidoreductase
MSNKDSFRVLVVDLDKGSGRAVDFGSPGEWLGGSGLAAALFQEYGLLDEPALHPDQPLVFTIGPLTGYFPLMSKAVLGFKSPYHQQYAETHAGGRLALSLRFAGYDALVVRGKAEQPSCLIVGRRHLEVRNIHYLWGLDVFSTGKWLRKIQKAGSGHRSIIRIGPAGENQSPYACINVDSYRHFGRLGAGAVMGAKNLKAMIVLGDGHVALPEGREYSDLYKDIYREVTESEVMRKYHDLGTPVNVLVLNAIQSLPWRNLQATQSEHAENISGEKFAEQLLLRQTACSGCPVGCIHVGLLREMFASEHEFIYRQVSYDHEPIFAMGTMLGMTRPSDVLTLIEEADRQGLDVMSAGVALAWATEALEKGIISEKETLTPLSFDDVHGYRGAIEHVAMGTNDFYRLLAQGTEKAAAEYGGREFSCVLGQEMAGYATGEVFFVSQAYGFRHSHLDSGGYGYDQKNHDKDVDAVVGYLLDDEQRRVELTCMVACLFSRNVYTRERLQNALTSIGQREAADDLPGKAWRIQALRWQLKFKTGYDPANITISERFRGITTFKGELDQGFMDQTAKAYQKATQMLAAEASIN